MLMMIMYKSRHQMMKKKSLHLMIMKEEMSCNPNSRQLQFDSIISLLIRAYSIYKLQTILVVSPSPTPLKCTTEVKDHV